MLKAASFEGRRATAPGSGIVLPMQKRGRMTGAEAWLALLLEHGYSRGQLMFIGERPRCCVADLAAAVALVQNPHSLDVSTPAMSEIIRQRILLGYLPHHLIVVAGGMLVLDREAVTMDVERIGFRR